MMRTDGPVKQGTAMGSSQSWTPGSGNIGRLFGDDRSFGSGFLGGAEASATSSVLVLVAAETGATLYSSCNGVSRFLRAIPYQPREPARGKHLDGTPVRLEWLARDLAGELEKMARGEPYEGVVIFSDISLHRALSRQVARRLPHLMVVCVNGLPEGLPDLSAMPVQARGGFRRPRHH
jgi:hypothetical protein